MDEGNDSGKNGAQRATVLLVIGEPFSEDSKNLILTEVTKGFRCWDVEETGIDINEELAQIANRADLGEEGPCVSGHGHQLKEGERIIRQQSESLSIEILVNPQKTSVTAGVKTFLSTPAKYRHLIYAGHAFQGSGAWILQDDTYTFNNFAHAFKDETVGDTLKQQQDAVLTIYTATDGDWTDGHVAKSDFSKKINVRLNPADKIEDIHGVLQFSAYVSNFVRVRQLNELLKSSDVVGNIKFSRPTMYIFPACQGDSALFGINGFNLLINGGYSRKACFWDFTRHLDRIDAALMTHLGTDNLFGLSTVLQRKKMENIHPEIGFMYVNATDKVKTPAEEDGEKKEDLQVNLAEEGHRLIQYARQIGPAPQTVSRPHAGQSIEPINLYHKVGIGSLDMYVLNPVTDSKELKDFYEQWNQNVAQFGSNWQMPLPNTLSVCALLVWKPSDPNDNITRVFFPGNAPQHKVLEGLEKLKSLDFLKQAQCTKTSLSAKPVGKKPAGQTSRAPKPKVSPVTTPRNETPKKEIKESIPKSSAPKVRSAPSPAQKAKKEREDAKKEKEDVNKKAMKLPEKPKAEKPDKGKKTPSPTKTPNKTAATAVKKASVKAPEPKPEPETVPDLIDTSAPAEEPPQVEDDTVASPGVMSEPLEPTPAPEAQNNLIDITPSSVPEPAHQELAGGMAMDKDRMRELGIYDDDQDIEQDLDAQQSGTSPEEDSQAEQQQSFGGMADSMHQDLMDYDEQNAMQGSYHADLMSGSMHEAMFDNKSTPFNGQDYYQNGGQTIDEIATPEDEKSEEIQPQALPDPVPYPTESFGLEPDVIPSIIGKEEPKEEDISNDKTAQEPDLLMGKQEIEEKESEDTLPVDERQAPVTPDEIENNLPEDVQEKDLKEMSEKEVLNVELEETEEDKGEQQIQPVEQEEEVYKDEKAFEPAGAELDEEMPSEQLEEELEAGALQSEEDVLVTEEKDAEENEDLIHKPPTPDIPEDFERPVSPEPDITEQEKLTGDETHDLTEETLELEKELVIEDSREPEAPVVEAMDKTETALTETEPESWQNKFDERPVMGRAGLEEIEPTLEETKEQMFEEREDSDNMPDSEEERAESPDSQIGMHDENRDSLEKDAELEPPVDGDYLRDSIEREADNQDENMKEDDGERDSIERDIPEPQKAEDVTEQLPLERDFVEDIPDENRYEEDIVDRSFSPESEEVQGEESEEVVDSGKDLNAENRYEENIGDRSFSPESEEVQGEESEEVVDSGKDLNAKESEERESEEREVLGSEERSDTSDQRQSEERSSQDRSGEDDEEEDDEEEEDEENSSFEQEEATDEKCLIQDSTSEDQRRIDDQRPMETDSLAAPADSLADQSTDNLVTPESEYTDASHGGQMGYHEIDEQDGDSVEGMDDRDSYVPQPSHPFGEGFDQFTSQGYSTGPMGNPFNIPESRLSQQMNPFTRNVQEDRSDDSDEEGRPQGGPAAFNPLAEWGEPMGLPSPAPPEEKAANANGANKKGVLKTKPPGPKKPGVGNDMKKPAAPSTKRPMSASKPAASNGVPEKTKSRPSLGATNKQPLNTSKVSASASLNTSRLSTGGKATPKPRPATAPTTKDLPDNKAAKDGIKRPSTTTGSRSPAVVKLPPLPAFIPFYVDLTYIPNHGNPAYCDAEFFKRIRARYYILSALVPNTDTLDALLEGKTTWEDQSITTTIIPTYDHEKLRAWMTINSEKLAARNIEVAPSASRCSIQLQDHETSSLAFRLEF